MEKESKVVILILVILLTLGFFAYKSTQRNAPMTDDEAVSIQAPKITVSPVQ
jgi:multidrug resistance efflux pump